VYYTPPIPLHLLESTSNSATIEDLRRNVILVLGPRSLQEGDDLVSFHGLLVTCTAVFRGEAAPIAFFSEEKVKFQL